MGPKSVILSIVFQSFFSKPSGYLFNRFNNRASIQCKNLIQMGERNFHFSTSNTEKRAVVGVFDTGVDTSHYKLTDYSLKAPSLRKSKIIYDKLSVIDSRYNRNKVMLDENDKIIKDTDHLEDHDYLLISPAVGANLVDDNHFFYNQEISKLYNQDFLRFSILHSKLKNGDFIESSDLGWYQEKLDDKDFFDQFAVFAEASHGTHVAGVILDQNSNTSFMSIRFVPEFKNDGKKSAKSLFSSDPLNMSDKKVKYKIKSTLDNLLFFKEIQFQQIYQIINKNNIKIANLSFGFPTGKKIINKILESNNIKMNESYQEELERHYNYRLSSLFQNLLDATPHTLFIMASGNESMNTDKIPYLNMLGNHPRGITVTAVNGQNQLTSFSNYGRFSVTVAALGTDITSCAPNNSFLCMSGTSQATPQVSNIAASLLEFRPTLGPEDLKNIILKSSLKAPDLTELLIADGGVVDKNSAIKYLVNILDADY